MKCDNCYASLCILTNLFVLLDLFSEVLALAVVAVPVFLATAAVLLLLLLVLEVVTVTPLLPAAAPPLLLLLLLLVVDTGLS